MNLSDTFFLDEIEAIEVRLRRLREIRESLDRHDPRGRYISCAITDLESGQNWLNRALNTEA